MVSDANNITVDTFNHTSNTLRQNTNAIFTSGKLDKLDGLADALKYLTINKAKYYESDRATASDTQSDPTSNPKTVTHTSNGNEKVTDSSNGNFEDRLLSNWTLPVVVLMINPSIDHMIAPILVVPQTLLAPATIEVISDRRRETRGLTGLYSKLKGLASTEAPKVTWVIL